PQLAGALAAPVAGLELPAVTRADQPFTVDETVGDPAAIVRALVVDDDQPAARQPRDCHRAGTEPRGDHRPDREVGDVVDLGSATIRMIRIVAKLVEEQRGHRGHAATLLGRSDSRARWRDRRARVTVSTHDRRDPG